jgi:chemotaxis protein MotB
MKKIVIFLLLATLLSSCGVNKEVHQKVLKNLAKTQKNYIHEIQKNKELKQKNNRLKKKITKLKKQLAETNQNFLDAMKFNDALKSELKAKGASLEDLESKKSSIDEQRTKLLQEREKMLAEQENLKEQLAELQKMKDAAEKRNAEFRKVMSKLQKMIDAGTLSVKIRKGRMIVSLSSDILFPSGRTTLTKEGEQAIAELCNTLKDLKDRSFLVVGHSDSSPIHTKRYPSNWELSSQRAIEVVKLMIKNGVDPKMLSAAGSAEFDPIASNDTDEGKAQNRRVEIVFMPKIEELPGFKPEKNNNK